MAIKGGVCYSRSLGRGTTGVSANNGVDRGGSGGKVEPCGQLHTRFTMLGIIF